MYKKLLYGIAAITALFHSIGADAQESLKPQINCRLKADFFAQMNVDTPSHGATSFFITPAAFPTKAIDTCGKFQVFYADEAVFLSTGLRGGFANWASGTTRRNTMCSVLQYIQSRFDFSKIPSGEFVRLYVDTSYSSAFPAPSSMYGFAAKSAPFHKTLSVGDTVNGFVYDFVTSGIDSNVGDYHAYLRMNFDKAWIYTTGLADTLTYNDGAAAPTDCIQIDLHSVLLHYITHTMGWLSWSDSFHTTTGSPSNYSNLDLSMHKTPLLHTVSNPFSFLSKAFPAGVSTSELCWVNGKLPPDNYLMHKGLISHFIQTEFNYFERRNSPGDEFRHVMQAGMAMGNTNREYTKADWETLHNSIGYKYNNSFETDSASIINNHLPFSRRMGSDVYNTVFVSGQPMEYLPNDYVLKNNVGTSISINLNSLSDLNDLDGDSVFIYPNSLVNFRGCGISGNNHNLLNVNTAQTIITYTPRANFYGRAQFGFNLTDKKGKGGFVVFTIDVTKGNNVSVSTGANLALNGDFEEGSEVKTNDTNLLVNNTIFFRYPISQHYSDSHPLDYSNDHFGTAIRNAYQLCRSTPSRLYNFGHQWNIADFSAPFYGGTYTTASPYLGIGNRYQPIALHTIPIYLGDTLKKCKRYLLEFDASHTLSEDPTILPYPKYDSIIIGFARDTFFNPTNRAYTMIQMKPYATDSIKLATWKHMRIPFTYCRDSSANIITLFIKGLNGFAPAYMVDNVKLTEVNDALAFKLKDTATGNCARRIFSDFFDLGCSTLSYSWRKLGGTSVIATTSSLDVNSEVTAQYVLTISDGCYSGSDTITITPCPCSVGAVFGAAKDSVLPASISASLSTGVYHLTADMLVTGSPTFSNALILIEPDVKITVANNAKLTLENCHLLTCPDTNKLWKGIELDNTTTTTGRIEIKKNTLIEDAEIAINALNPNNTSSDKIIDIEDAVFNRNIMSINIENFTLTSDSTYPFSVVNTVFTTRQFNKTGSGYPNTWTAAKALKDYTPNGTFAPYFLDVNYPKVRTKNDKPIAAGIKLLNIGNVVGSKYFEISIGKGKDSSDANLFDNTSTGIYAENTNLSCYNNIFINMISLTAPIGTTPSFSYRGCGIYANTLGTSPSRIRVTKDPLANGDAINKFFDCGTGIQSFGYYETELKFNRVSSSNTATTGYAGTAIYSTTASPCRKLKADFNDISNVSYGINISASSVVDSISINNNKIFAVNPWLPTGVSGAGQYLHQGILFDGASAGGTPNPVLINSNTIEEAYNGIEATNVKAHKLRVVLNNISKMAALASAKAQYGIVLRNTYGALVSENNIGMTSLASSNKIRAVYAAFNTNLQICANTSTNMDRAFDFAQVRPQVGTRWVLNKMDNSNKGFVLGSDIGEQGYTYITFLVPPHFYEGVGNKWTGIWGSGKWQTYVENRLNTNNSKLHVRRSVSPNEEPIFNYANLISPTYPQKYDTGSIIIKQGLTNCDGLILPTRFFPVSSGGVKPIKSLGMMVVSDSLGYDDKLSQWMAQLSVYESGLQDPVQIDSFPIFDRFMQQAFTSRYKWVADVQTALHNVDTNLAASLLSSIPQAAGRQVIDSDVIITDYNEADTLIDNYSSYYNAYLKYLKKQTLDTNALASLATKCPAKDGAAVYLARSLYALVSGAATSYDDDSCMDNGGGQYRIVQNPSITGGGIENQNYTLYPNPNNGTFILKQSIADNKSVNLKVYNALGALVYKGDASFVNGQINVKLGLKAQGVYLVCIGDNKERTTCLRFIIN